MEGITVVQGNITHSFKLGIPLYQPSPLLVTNTHGKIWYISKFEKSIQRILHHLNECYYPKVYRFCLPPLMDSLQIECVQQWWRRPQVMCWIFQNSPDCVCVNAVTSGLPLHLVFLVWCLLAAQSLELIRHWYTTVITAVKNHSISWMRLEWAIMVTRTDICLWDLSTSVILDNTNPSTTEEKRSIGL